MSEYIIKNGKVYDPKTGIKGDVSDVCIKDGKIAEKVSSKAKVIDAKGMTVMAGAVEVHMSQGQSSTREETTARKISSSLTSRLVRTPAWPVVFPYRPPLRPGTNMPGWAIPL